MGRLSDLEIDAFDLIAHYYDEDPDEMISRLMTELQMPYDMAFSMYEKWQQHRDENYYDEPDFDDESAFASAGWGTDESYGGW